jgi:hypothetical protein
MARTSTAPESVTVRYHHAFSGLLPPLVSGTGHEDDGRAQRAARGPSDGTAGGVDAEFLGIADLGPLRPTSGGATAEGPPASATCVRADTGRGRARRGRHDDDGDDVPDGAPPALSLRLAALSLPPPSLSLPPRATSIGR